MQILRIFFLIIVFILLSTDVFAEQKYPKFCQNPNLTIKLHDQGGVVKDLQVILGIEGFGYLAATGKYDLPTTKVVKKFQNFYKITPTGTIDPKTFSKMYSL
jgi:peptidoglycan hydrolase-like protein with peptidoglycan-binding domain